MDTYNSFLNKLFKETNYTEQLKQSFDINKLTQVINYQLDNHRGLLKHLDGEINSKQCLARISNGKQCSRNCQGDLNFCGNHSIRLPFGRIDEEIPDTQQLIIKGQRGRRNKNDLETGNLTQNKSNGNNNDNQIQEFENIDLNQYVKTKLISINGKDYLIDENNVIFSHDQNNNIVAFKINENNYNWLD